MNAVSVSSSAVIEILKRILKNRMDFERRDIGLNKTMKPILTAFSLLLLTLGLSAKPEPTRSVVYKHASNTDLKLFIFEPEGHKSSDKRPAAVFFFGGGWNGGTPSQFYPHCEYLASRGMVAMAADYRVASRQKTSPFECVEDGKSAVRWIRQNACSLGIDPNRLAAGGGSAGGHVAAATGNLPGLDSKEEDKNVSSKPNALLLFNPIYDNGPKGYGHSRYNHAGKKFLPSTTSAKELLRPSFSLAAKINSSPSPRPKPLMPKWKQQVPFVTLTFMKRLRTASSTLAKREKMAPITTTTPSTKWTSFSPLSDG